jgi:flagellar assembly factor FliW
MEDNKFRRDLILSITPYQSEMLASLEKDAIYEFPEGIPAFEDARRFSLLSTDEIKPFLYLKSLDIDGLGFVCIDPFMIYSGYLARISAADMIKLELRDASEAIVLSFVTVQQNPQENTANLLAPIIINLRKRCGRQIILDKYPVRYNIWDNLDRLEPGT